MSLKGRLLQAGVGVGGTQSQARAYAKTGLLAQSPSNGPFGNAPSPLVDPGGAVVFEDDFFEFRLNNSDEIGWVVTDIQGTNAENITSLNGYGGELRLYTGAIVGDGQYVQWHHTIARLKTDKKLWFAARVAVAQTSCMFRVGLANILAADPFGAGATDDIAFIHDSSNVLTARTKDADTTDTTLSAAMATNTYVELGFLWDLSAVHFYVDGTKVATHTDTDNIPVNVAMAPYFAAKTAAGANRAFYVDYLKFVQYR